MSISYDIEGQGVRKSWSTPLLVLAGLNAAFAIAMLSAWTAASFYLAEPLEWATWMRVNRGTSMMDVFDYPFVLLWMLPVGGVTVAWAASKSRQWPLVFVALTLPLLVLGLIVGWYYLTPTDWR